ncbi:MAG TPA: transcription antitermination factor NusB, partial [Gemmatimonadaceae bacterium]|nr:transcription antitermination factor NusB [Gemmatimonadaceae bacterium]
MPRLRAETRARARALQALYAWDLRDGEPLDRIASQVWDDLAIAPDERAFASRIVRTIIAEGSAIDDALRDVTTN